MQTEARVGVVNTTSSVVVEPRRQRQIGTASQLLAGGVAGAVSKTCTAPLARLTILFQLLNSETKISVVHLKRRVVVIAVGAVRVVQGMHSDASSLGKASIWHEALGIVRKEGVRAFWKGNLATIAHRLPYSSISFYAFEHYKNVGVESQGENVSTDICIRLVGGGLAGVTAASVTYPLDLVRTRLATQYLSNAEEVDLVDLFLLDTRDMACFVYISKEEGVFGLYKGLGATLLGVGPNLAISFSVYETARSYWHFHRPEDSTVLVSLTCGSLSGIASSTVYYVLLAFENSLVYGQKTGTQREWSCLWFLFLPYLLHKMSQSATSPPSSTTPSTNEEQRNIGEKVVAYPLDLVRRRMQLEGAGGRARVYNTGLFGTLRHIIRSEGWRGLYRGILPEYYKVVPSVGIVFMTYEKLKQLLSSIPES
ncbi:Calcium-binding mitochondrial carrier protein SCaMC-1 [Sesamum angolense]|uniref:Calcium-binding mitochondrial carrier protein SCaMC-1 n=1 Tax=Sesamum angolense TaxID=2727404 RepID=A0AAE2BH68_9LAMI|nr:Calcium-binding mitochondrial carrier protein SCaMC-1 [Sesamum angolense]